MKYLITKKVFTLLTKPFLSVKQATTVKRVHYWSDGAGSQFKNCYNLACLLYHKKDFGSEATWSFFETAYCKGPVDGVEVAWS